MFGYWEIAQQRPDDVAVVDRFGERTWSGFVERVELTVGALRAEGLEPGDHVAMVMGNRAEFLEVSSACVMAGFFFTPVNWHLAPDEAAYIVDDCDAKVFLYDDHFAALGAEMSQRVPGLRRSLETGEGWEAWLAAAEAVALTPDEGQAGGGMLYSSGTTGRPKGVFRPPAAGVAPAEALGARAQTGPLFGIQAGGVHLVTGPLYHAAPLGFGSIAFQSGNTMILMHDWTAEATLDLIDKHGVTNSHLVPTMFRRLLSLPDQHRAGFDGSSLTGILHGAAPCPVPVKAAMIEWWGPVIYEYYGATEGGLTAVDSPTWLEHPGTVGRALPAWDVFAVGPDGEELPADEVGRIFFRVKATTDTFRYWKDPEKTERAHIAPGTFTLGDIGRVDHDGFVYLTDRASDMIISGGVNIYPAEIEAVLVTHPAVADAAVFGIPHDDWGEEVKAAIELKPGETASEADLIAFCRDQLAHYKCPRSVDFETKLPRHPTGKLYKRLLRDRYWQGTGRMI